jgi:hypothetical protein
MRINSINDCKAEATIFQNEMDIGHKFSLAWMSSESLPVTCQDASNNEREFASSYIGDLFGVGRSSITILPASTAKLLLLFTFNESDFIYLVAAPWNRKELLSTAFSWILASTIV